MTKHAVLNLNSALAAAVAHSHEYGSPIPLSLAELYLKTLPEMECEESFSTPPLFVAVLWINKLSLALLSLSHNSHVIVKTGSCNSASVLLPQTYNNTHMHE